VFSGIELIALDIDGTLLDRPDAELAEVISDLNKSLRHYRRGVSLTIATGRAFAGARPVIERLALPRDTPIIVYNGAVVCSATGNDLVRLVEISSALVRRVVSLALLEGHSAYVYEPELSFPLRDLHWSNESPLSERVKGFTNGHTPKREFNGLEVDWCSDLESLDRSASAVLIEKGMEVSDRFKLELGRLSGVDVTQSGGSFVEIRPHGANKGLALSFVARKLGLQQSQVLAIGDNDNDVEMLQWAGSSVCVANSTDSAVGASDYVTKGAAGSGVVEILRVVLDAKRHRMK
jgi:Cof subfamily protein (haloacid dehalogenase superfamily)